ncbi:MAG: hypothetical protein Q9227_006169 [Pyrenula ochraceoflavens]
MFFLKELSRQITIHPSFFGKQIREQLTGRLYEDVEGTCQGEYYVICITHLLEISLGKVIPGNGQAEFTCSYRAIVWKPFKHETVDAMVSGVNAGGIFADVGPLPIFISHHLIPGDIKYDGDATPPQWTNGADETIEKGTAIRVKIIGLRSDVGQINAVGSITDDFYGAQRT